MKKTLNFPRGKKEISEAVKEQKRFFAENRTKDLSFRINALKKLLAELEKRESRLLQALYLDLGKSRAEAYMTEIAMVKSEIHDALKHIRVWSKPKKVPGTLGTFPAKSFIYKEPYGSVLIAAPWNYPVNLTLSPLVAAIAAGNCVILKCSKSSPHTSRELIKMISDLFLPRYICCIHPGAEYDDIMNQNYDYIFFTGSPKSGRHVMEAAGKRLTPVTLELGGKSPCIVDKTADLKLAAKRIVWGKFLNAGQTCISVDYIYVHEEVKQKLIMYLCREIERLFPEAQNDPLYPKIISNRHFNRLYDLIASEEWIIGGQVNKRNRKIAPAILPECGFDHIVMREEIFGPVLPVITFSHTDEMIKNIRRGKKPLACYVFTAKEHFARRVINELSFGGGCINDVILHISNPHLPFGGVGHSGTGKYHGKYGFDTFTNEKGIVKGSTRIDLPFRYGPYTDKKLRLFKKLL